MKKPYRFAALIALGWFIGSCGGGDGVVGPPPPPTTASVTLASGSGTLVPGASLQLSATAKDQAGQVLSKVFAWTSSDQSKATVSSSGMVAGVAAGAATITASVDGKSASVTVNVLDGGVVSSAGATISVRSGEVEIVVPADALGSTTNVSVVPSSSYTNDPRVIKAFDFGPTGTTFAKPVSLTIKYAGANLPQGTEEPAFQLYFAGSAGWEPVAGSVVDISKKTVTAPVSHFSVYAILTPLPVAAVTIGSSPAHPILGGSANFIVGDAEQLTATLTDAQGGTLSNRAITWASSNPAVASVTTGGLVTAIAAGTATVSATAGGVTSSITVNVTPVPVAVVAVTLSAQSVQVGQTSQASAATTDAAGHPLTGRTVTWSSGNTAVATVSATGLVTATGVGTATITATSEGKTGSATITVSAVPVASVNVTLTPNSITAVGTSQASAVTLDANGSTLTGRSLTWSSGNTAVATVSADGVVTAVAPGTASITATSEGKTGSATLTVTPAAVATITVSPSSVTIVREGTQQLTATLEDAHHNVLTGRVIEWNTDAPDIATVSSSGLVSAIAAGVAHISAVSEGKIGTTTVTVTPTPVASVSVSLASASLIAGQTTQATATTFDAGGNQLSGRTITWTSSNPSVATVSSTGLVTSLTGGSAQIIATSEAKTGDATLTVAAAVASINVTLTPSSITAVGTSQATATTRDATGGVLTGRVVTWSSDNTAVATVSATTGAVTAVSVGTANVVATSEGKTGSALLTVTQAPVATVTVDPPSATVFQGETEQLTVTLRDARNNILTRPVTWSSNNAVASVSPSGLVTAAAAMMGTATITATSEGQSGTSSITVTQVPVATISVVLAPNTVNAGQNSQATATLRDAANNVLTGRTIAWTSDNLSVATVSSSGVVTTLAAGTANIGAASGGKNGSAPLTVLPVVSSVTLSAPTTPTVLGQTQQLTAIPKDAGGNALAGRTVNWVSSNPTVLSVSAASSVSTLSGATITVTSAGLGTAIISASSESAPSVSTPVITVNPIPVATVTVNPSSATLVIGSNPTQQLSTTLRDVNSNILAGRTVTWTSNNPSAATVDANGFVTAVAGGSTTITATSEGKTGTSSITVTAPVATVTVNPSSATLSAGVTHQLTATLKDANNNTLTGRVVTWTSSNPENATVSTSGLVTAVAAGPAIITATSEGQGGSSSITVTPIPVATVSVALAATSIQVGQTTQATATTFDGTGTVLTGRVVTWSSGNTGIATVSPSGVVTAVSAGSTTIIATSEGKTGSAPLSVIPVPVGSVTVTPGSATVIAGNTQQLSAETRDANGVVVSDRLVTWSSSNTAIATVTGSGLVTAISVGPATITATSEGKSGISSITVVPVPVASVTVALSPNSITAVGTSQATATTLDSHGGVLSGRAVAWSSSNTAVATVSQTGLVTAVAVGSASIVATSEGQTGSATLTVTQAPVASVTVTPAPTTVVQGATEQLTATPKDALGRVLTGRSITWSSNNPAVATVSLDGLVSAISVGAATISATSEGQSGTSAVTVSPVPVASVTVALGSSTITDAQTTQATATLRDAGGNVLTGRTVTWSSDNTAVASVSAGGVVTPVAAGSTTIRATSGGQTGTAPLTVIPSVASVTVTPSPANVVIGTTLQLTAATKDVNGNVLAGRSITWSSDAPSIVSVSPSGLVTGIALGAATISATSEGKTGTSSISVVPVPVALVTVSLASTSINVGQTTQATATTRDGSGNILTGRSISWSSGNTAIATVSSAGVVTAVGPGSVQIIAMSETKTGGATLTVTPAPVASVTLSAPVTPMIVGGTQQVTATTRDANGNILTGRTITWVSSNTAVLTVTASGSPSTVTAVGVGTATITATSESISSAPTPTITVNPIPVATVTVSPPAASLVLGITPTQQLTAATKDVNGNVLTGRLVTWTSSNTAAATVSASGLVTAVGAGATTVTATSEGQTGTSSITVSLAPVATVTLSAPTTPMIAGATQQLTATPRDANGNVLTGRTITWVSSNTAVLTVSATGSPATVTAVGVGTATITATSEAVSSSPTPTITVNPVPVATVTVSPTNASLVLGITPTQQLTAVTKDANGNVLTGRSVTWSSSNTAAATVNGTGLVTAVGAGSATITATSEGQTGTSAITVSLAPVASVTVSAPTTPMIVGQTQQLTATTRDANGNLLTGRAITWVSSNTSVLTVSASGSPATVTAVAVGTATITATSESVSSAPTPTITVNPVPVATVTVSPATATLVLGITPTQQLTAVTKDAGGNVLTGRVVTWSSSNTAAATVSTTGLVTAAGVGSTTITAMSEGQTGTSSITVTLAPVTAVTLSAPTTPMIAGNTQVLTATPKDANGTILSGRTVNWSSSNTAVLTVSAASSVSTSSGATITVTAVGEGTATITGSSEAAPSATTPVITVNPVPVATVTVSPPTASLVLGITPTQQLTAVTKDAGGNVLTGRPVTWSSSNTAAATVSGTGLVTAVGAGSATITATSEGQTGTSGITVTLAPVATVTLSAPTTPMIVGGTQQLTATARDANGNILTGRTITWVSSNTAVLTVSATGSPATVTAVGVGTATITATSESVSSSPTPTITVNPVPVATVTVSPASATLVLGITPTQQLTAVTKDGNGNVLTGRDITWLSSNTAAAAVSATGLVTAVAAGTATITATSEGQNGTSSITVTVAPVATVTVSAPTTPMIVGETQQLTATTRDANGNVLTGRTISWVSSNPTALTVSASGSPATVTAVAVGTATVTATSESVSSSPTPTITVNPVPVASVTVTPATATLVLGITPTQQLTAETKDGNGNVLTGRTIDWVSSNTAAATVDANGLVTAVGAGSTTITATSEGQSGSSSITVTPAPVTTVTLSAPTTPMIDGTSQVLTAVPKDANGTTLVGRTVNWVSSNTAVLTVSAATSVSTSTGATITVTAVGVGTATISATSESAPAATTPTITVNPVPVATVTVSAPTTAMNVGATQQLTATLKDASDHVLTGRLVSWVSSNTAVLTVNPASGTTGVTTVTAVSAGSATITASSESITSSPTPTITVTQQVVSVTLSTPITSMAVGGTQILTAIPKDGVGNHLSGRTVTWVSSDPTKVALSAASSVSTSSGATVTITAIEAGNATITATSETAPGATTPTITIFPALAAGPLRVSTVNRRYFADPTGRVVYLTGSEYWKTIQDNGPSNPPPTFDYSAFLDFLQSHNHNFTRLYMWEQARWSAETSLSHWFSPTLYLRTGSDTALDGGPKFDVTQINPAYLARLRQRVIDAGARGIYVSVMLFNGWSVGMKGSSTAGNPWLAHPFNSANNINGINGDPNGDNFGGESQTLSIPEITAIQDAYVRAVVDAVNDLDNVIYEISNESEQSADAWQYHMIDLVRSYEATKPKQHPVGMTVPYPTSPPGTNDDVMNSTADWVSRNGDVNEPDIADGTKVSLLDTDHVCGICGDPSWPWKSMMQGHNPLLMDGYDGSAGVGDPLYNPSDPVWNFIRDYMGYARSFALRMDLAHAVPHPELSTSGYCLAVPANEYLVLLPTGGSVDVNLSGLSGTRTVEWYQPRTQTTIMGPSVSGGSTVTFTSPFSNSNLTVLYIHP